MQNLTDITSERAIWIALAQAANVGRTQEVLHTLRQKGLKREWFSSKAIGQAVATAMTLYLRKEDISLVSIMSHSRELTEPEWKSLAAGWHDAQSAEAIYHHVGQYVPSLKRHYTMRVVENILMDLRDAREEDPTGTNRWLPHFIQRLQTALKDSRDYDPTPSVIWNKSEPTKVIASTGIETLDDAFRGGIRNGMLVVWVSPTKAGKSRMTYTMAAHAVAQKCPIAIISTEARPFDAVAGVLQAYAGYDDYEIESKQGRDPGRHELMSDALLCLDQYLSVWDAEWGTATGIEEVLYWAKPKHLILDHMMPMVLQSNRQRGDKLHQRIYDFSVYLEGAAIRHECTITVFAQLSADNARRLLKKKDLPDLPAFGSSGPGHAASIGILSMRDPDTPNTMLGRVKLDRIKGLMDTEFKLKHDPDTHTFHDVV